MEARIEIGIFRYIEFFSPGTRGEKGRCPLIFTKEKLIF